MHVRFGYVAMSVIVKNASPSKTMTATRFAELSDREAGVRKLERLGAENLHNTLRLLRHNRAHDIQVFRFSSRLIPLVGHTMLGDWDPITKLAGAFAEVGNYVREHGMRTSFHPDHFTVLTTPREEVLRASVGDLQRHVRMFEAMGLDERAKCNIHIGGTYNDKASAMMRFRMHFSMLDKGIRNRLTLENDDKTYTAAETLGLCEELGVPMVLDVHHDQVNPSEESAVQLWPRIVKTWEGTQLPPKIHMSSPKDGKDPRAHADFINAPALLRFLHSVAEHTPNLDVMIEAKQKDGALFRLMRELDGEIGVRLVDQAAVEILS
jgi:UV DNA damage endonuclease